MSENLGLTEREERLVQRENHKATSQIRDDGRSKAEGSKSKNKVSRKVVVEEEEENDLGNPDEDFDDQEEEIPDKGKGRKVDDDDLDTEDEREEERRKYDKQKPSNSRSRSRSSLRSPTHSRRGSFRSPSESRRPLTPPPAPVPPPVDIMQVMANNMAQGKPIDNNMMMFAMMNMMQQMTESNRRDREKREEREDDRYRSRGETTPIFNSSHSEPKAGDPEPFTGNANKLETFIQTCRLNFDLQPSRFRKESIRVGYILTFLRGNPADAVGPLIENDPDGEIETVERLVSFLRMNYGDPDKQGTALRNLRKLKQTKSAAEYFSKFRQYVTILGYRDQRQLVTQAIDGLDDRMKDELTRYGNDRFSTVNELARWVTPLDNRFRARDQEKVDKESRVKSKDKAREEHDTGKKDRKENRGGDSSKGSSTTDGNKGNSSTSSSTGTTRKTEGSAPRRARTKEDYDRIEAEGLCRICMGNDHKREDCPVMAKKKKDGTWVERTFVKKETVKE